MLFTEENTPSRVYVGKIYDHFYRIPQYGPFTNSPEYYQTRREWFLVTLRECMANRDQDKDDLLYGLMLSSRAFFACCLDDGAILATRRWLPKPEFEKFVAKEQPVAGENSTVHS